MLGSNVRPSSNDDQTKVEKQKVEKEDNKTSNITNHFKPVSRKQQKTLKPALNKIRKERNS